MLKSRLAFHLSSAVIALAATLAPVHSASAGTPTSETTVAPETGNRKVGTAIASDALGNFVVVWTQINFDSSFNVLGQRFDSGRRPLGAVFQVNDLPSSGLPAIGMAADGQFFVVWPSRGSGLQGSGIRVLGRRYSALGEPEAAPFVIDSSPSTNGTLQVDVAVNTLGEAAVVWNERSLVSLPPLGTNTIITTTVFLQRYARSGRRDGLAQTVSRSSDVSVGPIFTYARDSAPRVALNTGGQVVVTWAHEDRDGVGEIQARRYGPLGASQGAAFQVSSDSLVGDAYFPKGNPDVVLDDAGRFTVSWQGVAQGVAGGDTRGWFKRLFAADGQPLQAEVLVSGTEAYIGQQGDTRLALDGNGNPVLTWARVDQAGSVTSTVVLAQRFDGNGALAGAPIQLSTVPGELLGSLALASAPSGFVAGWSRGVIGNFGVVSRFPLGSISIVTCCSIP